MLGTLRNKLRELGPEGLSPRSPTTYLLAMACVAVAALADFAFGRFIDDITLSIAYYPAVFVVTLFGGVPAGIVAVILGAAAEWSADTQFFGDQAGALIRSVNGGLYVITAALIIWVAQRFRHAGDRLQQAEVVVRLARVSATTNRRLRKLRQVWRTGLPPNSPAAYAIALVCVAAATVIRFGLGWFGEDILPFACFYPTILFVVLIAGPGAGLFAMVLSLIVVGLAFVPPYYVVGWPTRDQVADCGLFLFASMLAIWLAEKYRHGILGSDRNPVADMFAPIVVSLGAVLLTTLALLALEPKLAAHHLLIGYLVPTVIVAILYGSAFAFLTSIASGAAAAYFLFRPKFSLYVVDPIQLAELTLFLLGALAVSTLLSLLIYGVRGKISNEPPKDGSLFFRDSSVPAHTGVLLIHGIGGTPLEFKTVATGLMKRGFTVSCCQLAGHGGTEDDLLASHWADWFASAERALDDLEKHCDVIVVGGLSVGSMLALRLADLCATRVHGVCLFSPALRYNGWAVPWYSFLLWLGLRAPFLKRMRFRDPPPYGIKDEVARALVAGSGEANSDNGPHTSLGVLQECHKLVRDVVQRLPSIAAPALIIHPREDDLSDLSNAFFLQRWLAGPVQTLVLDDSYHLITVDRQRDVVMERTADFISFIERRTAEQRRQSAARLTVVSKT